MKQIWLTSDVRKLFHKNPHTFCPLLWFGDEKLARHDDGILARVEKLQIKPANDVRQPNVQLGPCQIQPHTHARSFAEGREVARERLVAAHFGVMQPARWVEGMAIWENTLIMVHQICAHAKRDACGDGPVAILNGSSGGHAGKTLGDAVRESKGWDRLINVSLCCFFPREKEDIREQRRNSAALSFL